MTPLPTKTLEACMEPEKIMPALTELRNAALTAGNFEFAVILSYTHAWMYWLNENWKELNGENP